MDATHLKVWLPFDESTTLDRCGNTWTATGSPVIENSALKLDGSSYLKMDGSITLGGKDFTIDGWFNLSSSTDNWPRVFALFNTADSDAVSIQLQRREKTTNFRVCCNGSYSDTFSVSLDTRHHFELDYVHSASTVYVFIDGTLMKSFTKAIDATTYATVSLGLSNFTVDAKFIGSIDEFQIYDGVALHTTDFTPPTAADYDAITSWAVTANADVEALIANRDPSSGYWRYENPGSGDYIYYHDNITTEQVDFDKSVTGVAFWGGDRNDMVGIPAGCKELWIRLDLWVHSRLEGINYDTDFGFGSMTTNSDLSLAGYRIWSWVTPTEVGHTLCINKTMYFTLRTGSRNSILVYLKSGETDGEICGTVGSSTRRYIGNVNNGDDFGNVFFWSTTNSGMFSNIVVSNAPLSLEDGWHREPAAVEFNIKAVDLCVRKNGRNYVIPFSTTNSPPAGSVVAKVGGKKVYNPLVATDDENASPLRTRCNGRDRAFSASFG